MFLIIDGYNLLGSSTLGAEGPGNTSLERARNGLLQWLLAALSPREAARTTIVFDAREAPPGLPRSYRYEELDVQFAPRGSEADEVIEELIAAHSAPRNLLVVSSDHRIQRAARRRKAKFIDSEQFFADREEEAWDEEFD